MFELEREVFVWRREMSRHEATGVETLDELEAHLIEEFDQLREAGLDEEQAFRRAAQSLGSGAEVHAELAKVDVNSVARNRARWILIGFLMGPLVLRLARFAFDGLLVVYEAGLPESGGVESTTWGVPEYGVHSLGILIAMMALSWLGVRWLSCAAGLRWLHKCARMSRRPLTLAAGVITLTLLCMAASVLRGYWFAEDGERTQLLSLAPVAVARLLLPLLLIQFLARWREDLAAHSAVFWVTGGWLLLSLCMSLFHLAEPWLLVAWSNLPAGSWPLSDRAGLRGLTFFSWDALVLFLPFAFLLAIVVQRSASNLLRRPQAMILWATRHPILLGLGCLAVPIFGFLGTQDLARSHGVHDFGAMALVRDHISLAWLFTLPLFWALALGRLPRKPKGGTQRGNTSAC